MNDDQQRRTIQETHDAVIGMVGKLDTVCEKVENHETILDGPPANGNSPGLKTRMDRQEQFRGRVNCALGVGGVAIVGLVADLIFNCFVSH